MPSLRRRQSHVEPHTPSWTGVLQVNDDQIELAQRLRDHRRFELWSGAVVRRAAPGDGENWYRLSESFGGSWWGREAAQNGWGEATSAEVILDHGDSHVLLDLTCWQNIGALMGMLVEAVHDTYAAHERITWQLELDYGEAVVKALLEAWGEP